MAKSKFSWGNYVIRLVAALVLVLVTYNPEGFSFYHWVKPILSDFAQADVLMALAGVVLLIGWVVFLRASLVSLGAFGLLLATAFFACLIWVLITYVGIPEDNFRVVTYLILAGLAGVLSIGISWSHVRRRMSGQLDVDETEL